MAKAIPTLYIKPASMIASYHPEPTPGNTIRVTDANATRPIIWPVKLPLDKGAAKDEFKNNKAWKKKNRAKP